MSSPLDDLAKLISIRSVSPDPSSAAELGRAAAWIADRIVRMGGTASVERPASGRPLVVGEIRASRQPARDVLAYAHFDVQAAGDGWATDPFELVERDGRLSGRGVADDKANLVILLHGVATLAASGGPPVNVRFLVDGEEEIAGSSADEWLLADDRGADVALLLDGSVETLTTGIRGLAYGYLRLRTGDAEQHSGFYGGAALAATDALVRTLAAALPGPDGLLPAPLRVGVADPSPEEEEGWRDLPPGSELLREVGLRPADPRAGPDFHRRTRAEPSLTVHGIASGDAAQYAASVPVDATASFSLRPVAGQSADEVARAFERLVRDACPAAATIDVEWLFRYNGAATPLDAPELGLAAAAIERNFGRRPALVRSGAGLPLLETLAARGIPAVATGFAVESEANMHGPNESFPRAHIELGITTVSELLGALGS